MGASLSNTRVCLSIAPGRRNTLWHSPHPRSEAPGAIEPRHVKTREADGQVLHYVEGWHVVAEANRIFGFEGWDRETVASDCVWGRSSREAATARLRGQGPDHGPGGRDQDCAGGLRRGGVECPLAWSGA